MELAPKGIARAHLDRANIGEDYWACDFNNYLGPSSAADLAKTYLRRLDEMKSQGIGLLFAGPPGPGKTTLAAIVLKYLARANWTCYMISLGDIVEHIQRGWSDKDEDSYELLDRAKKAHFLLIDDIGKEHAGPTGFSATVFDNLIRYRTQHRLPTILTTNLTEREIRNRYGDAFVSLIRGKCKVVEVDDQDVRTTTLKPAVEKIFQ